MGVGVFVYVCLQGVVCGCRSVFAGCVGVFARCVCVCV